MSSVPRVPIQVLGLSGVGTWYVRLLGLPVGVWLHWSDEKPKPRSRPCTGDDCRHCKEGSPVRWTGYAPALWWTRDHDRPGKGRWLPVVCPLNEAAAAKLPDEVLGLVVQLQRAKRNGPVVLLQAEQPQAPPETEPFDVRPVLLRMWGVAEWQNSTKPAETGEKVRNDEPPLLPFRRPGPDRGQDGNRPGEKKLAP